MKKIDFARRAELEEIRLVAAFDDGKITREQFAARLKKLAEKIRVREDEEDWKDYEQRSGKVAP
jgi:hypothetical protein